MKKIDIIETESVQEINNISQVKSKHAIEEIIKIKRKYNLTPQQFRYCCKMVREKEKMQIPKTSKGLPDYLNAAEVFHLLDISKNDTFANLLIEFLIKTGLRINEARNVLVSDLDFSNHQLKVREGKGSKDRYVPLAHSLQRRLLTFLNGRKTGYLFCKSNGTQHSKRNLQYKIQGFITKAHFNKNLSTHSLRHTFACILISKGVELEKIQLLMGHSHKSTTEIYAKLELGAVKEQLLQIME